MWFVITRGTQRAKDVDTCVLALLHVAAEFFPEFSVIGGQQGPFRQDAICGNKRRKKTQILIENNQL